MGKVRIVGGGDNGQYSVEVLHNRDRIDAEIDFLAEQIAEMIARRDELQAEYDEAVVARNAATAAVDEKVAQYIAGGSDGVPDVEAELIALAQASAKVQMIDVDLTMIKGRLLQTEKRKEALDNIPKEEIQPAWCADYTESLEGEVRSVEVPDEGREFLLIHPGYNNGHVYNRARDGQLFWREGQVGYQAYFNAAILPGVQRWKPQYRFATIESLDRLEDTATIAYASMDSSAQSLLITDPNAKRADVPIEYMLCNSAVFEEGDQVLVELQDRDWQKPRIIGFRDNPKPCGVIVAFQLGAHYTSLPFLDSNPSGYPAVPEGVDRNRGVTKIEPQVHGPGAATLLYARNLEQVIGAELISELPPHQAAGFFGLAAIKKGEIDVATVSLPRNVGGAVNVPVNGTLYIPPGTAAVYPLNKPPDTFTLTEQEITILYRHYAADHFEFYDVGGDGQVYWSHLIDTGQLAGEASVSLTLADFPETIGWLGVTHERDVFVSYVQPDFDPGMGAEEYDVGLACVMYRPVPG